MDNCLHGRCRPGIPKTLAVVQNAMSSSPLTALPSGKPTSLACLELQLTTQPVCASSACKRQAGSFMVEEQLSECWPTLCYVHYLLCLCQYSCLHALPAIHWLAAAFCGISELEAVPNSNQRNLKHCLFCMNRWTSTAWRPNSETWALTLLQWCKDQRGLHMSAGCWLACTWLLEMSGRTALQGSQPRLEFSADVLQHP